MKENMCFAWLLSVLVSIWKIVRHTASACFTFLIRTCRPRSLPDFSSEIALVTGAGHGLGKQLAFRLAECGAKVVLWDINEENVRSVCDELNEQGREAFAYRVDCSNREEIYAAADTVRKEVGNVSILVNNAGVVFGKSVLELSDSQIELTTKVNYLAHFWTVRAFLPWMVEKNHGFIVPICSVASFTGSPIMTDYCSSKAAAYIFADSLRAELIKELRTGITVTAVCPWHIDTGMFDGFKTKLHWLIPALKPDDVALATVLAIADREYTVILPRSLSLTVWIKYLFPAAVVDELIRLILGDKAMDNFVNKKD